ncbi:MAG TPA: Fe-S cluster assembly ATPase SufC [Dehalococcoidia bacterium]|jgi:Fe-S cluster assembly ATP-binding protein|nr:Fe-S cluster assembly ATPase SufC [Chloroflexota bacterium]MDP5876679.1 Fe-S cluster assembly ATPase SufC [Dehalococcoidia bacterium]MDP6272440.1 Fe-S cluster assembly ATPase SufC [Dehalococcoidia bacterium]MDP7160810.1 Fe-S cluster assembly ATPase SufC [Dehalococcoidia bacterium]MDP7213263.1 Fe-S cluster assembly ATPase SufC [Dehalococcoidia bacterium]|tara:strand:- start:765 stop:1526 length:762 start_codon:yes stop_codon:yes gene_type:complete
MLQVTDLHAAVIGAEDAEILKSLSLTLNAGEVHAIMGPNGSGKSTFANVLMGRPDYVVNSGSVKFDGEDILEMVPDQRALRGMFLAFQYPAEIPGVRPWQFLKAALDARREFAGEDPLSVRNFSALFDGKVKDVGIDPDLVKRSLNEGFSGGEKKRHEMLQLEMLEPRLAILDETDSGLDVDALRIVAEGVNNLRSTERSFLIVTHYQRLLNYIKPDVVHILVDGRIVETGGADLAMAVENTGYEQFINAADD